jgi:ABC-type multidrug transport system fused ATPase/permease subunit
MRLEQGEHAVIVGSSGAGKTTLVDVILGVIDTQYGSVAISNMKPLQAILTWPGAIAYVPQDVVVIEGSVKANIALGLEAETIPDELFWRALEFSQLKQFVQAQADGLNTHIGVGGIRLSGGQRQRMGIARARLSEPKVVVLDEATSALDNTTELEVSNSLGDLNGEVTLIIVAHRLSTVRKADRVLYFDKGKIIAEGTFEEVRKLVPDFDKHANLMKHTQ